MESLQKRREALYHTFFSLSLPCPRGWDRRTIAENITNVSYAHTPSFFATVLQEKQLPKIAKHKLRARFTAALLSSQFGLARQKCPSLILRMPRVSVNANDRNIFATNLSTRSLCSLKTGRPVNFNHSLFGALKEQTVRR